MKAGHVLAGATLCLLGCGGDEGGATFDPDQFAGMYQPEIHYDCQETVQCRVQQGLAVSMDDPVGECTIESGKLLNGSENRQESFLADYGRCANFRVCDYVNCVQGGGASYGDTMRPTLSAICTHETNCSVERGSTGTTHDVCVEVKVNELNTFVPTKRAMWESAWDACMDMASCAFVDCFDSALLGATGG